MNYYTSTIQPTLAEKLKEKGMPMTPWTGGCQILPYVSVKEESDFARLDKELGGTPQMVENRYVVPVYSEVLDWLMERGLRIVIEPSWDFANEKITDMWDCDIVKVGAFSSQPKNTISQHDTWHEAAEKAIEKALTLI